MIINSFTINTIYEFYNILTSILIIFSTINDKIGSFNTGIYSIIFNMFIKYHNWYFISWNLSGKASAIGVIRKEGPDGIRDIILFKTAWTLSQAIFGVTDGSETNFALWFSNGFSIIFLFITI